MFDAAARLAKQADEELGGRGEVRIEGSREGSEFAIRVGDVRSRIVTTVVGERAFTRILGDGLLHGGARELDGVGELVHLFRLLMSDGYRQGRAPTGSLT